eukprot:gene15150-biopygen15225
MAGVVSRTQPISSETVRTTVFRPIASWLLGISIVALQVAGAHSGLPLSSQVTVNPPFAISFALACSASFDSGRTCTISSGSGQIGQSSENRVAYSCFVTASRHTGHNLSLDDFHMRQSVDGRR